MQLRFYSLICFAIASLHSSCGADDWIHDDLDRGFRVAEETGKPLLIVIRCPP